MGVGWDHGLGESYDAQALLVKWLDENQQSFEYRGAVIRAKRGVWEIAGTELQARSYGRACILVDRLIQERDGTK